MTDIVRAGSTPWKEAMRDFRAFGRNEVAYIRRYEVNNQPAFVLHGADGAALAVQHDKEAAAMSACQQALEVLSVH